VFSVQQGALSSPPVRFENEVRRGRNVADAAAAAGAEHLVYASVAGADRATGAAAFDSKREIEQYIRRSGMPATILRPVSFMDNYAGPAFGIQTGALVTPLAPGVPEQMIALADIGAFVALAFADPARYLGTAVAIAGDELTPATDRASAQPGTGQHIRHVQIPVEAPGSTTATWPTRSATSTATAATAPTSRPPGRCITG
jgi:uncharacterized protein YbjT (DUF2867 family)